MVEIAIGPESVDELQALVDRSVDATFLLAPGDYLLPTLLLGQSVRQVGKEGAARTTLRPTAGGLAKVFGGVGPSELCGLTLTGGRADGGGGIELHNDARLVVRDCVLTDNQAEVFRGGAIHALAESELVVERSIFRANRCQRGGGLAVADTAKARVDRCLFEDNEAELGGAVWLSDEAELLIASSTFVSNRASHEQGGDAVFATGYASGGPSLRLINALMAGQHALVNNAERPGRVEIKSCVLPPGTLAAAGLTDGGGNLEVQADLLQVGPGLWALRPGAAGAAAASVADIAAGARDLLGRPLVVDGRADPGALAAPDPARVIAGQYDSIES